MNDPSAPIYSAFNINDKYYTVDVFNGTDPFANLTYGSSSNFLNLINDNPGKFSDLMRMDI